MNKGIFYNLPDKYKHSFAFNSSIKSVVSEEKDKYLSKASVDKLRDFIPNIDSRKIDLLPWCADCFVANRINENDDGVATEEALIIADLYPLSFVDVEHDRKNVVGVILSAGFSEFGTDKILTREDVSKYTKPFNVWVGGVLWKVPCPDLANYIEETNDKKSKEFLAASLSWEIAFGDYNLIVIDPNKRNFEDGRIVSDAREISKLESKLRSFGGNGITTEGKKIGLIPKSDVLPVGVGITNLPAASVKGIAVNIEEDNMDANINDAKKMKKSCGGVCPECGQEMDMEDEMDDEMEIECAKCKKSNAGKKWKGGKDKEKMEEKANLEELKSSILGEITKNMQEFTKSLSQSSQHVVNSNSNKFMKVKNIKDLTGETLKEITASEIQEIYAQDLQEKINAEVKKISDDFEAKKNEKDKAIKAANDQILDLDKSVKENASKYAELEKKLNETTENYNKLVQANEEKTKLEVFSARLQTLDEQFNLSDEEKKIVGDELKAIDSDEAFAKYQAKMDVLLAKSKKVFDPKTKKWVNKEDMKEHGGPEPKEAKASTNVVEEVKGEEKVVTATIPNTSAVTETLADKAKKAFGVDSYSIDNNRKIRKVEKI